MIKGLETINLMQPTALLALCLVPLRWLLAPGTAVASVGKLNATGSHPVGGDLLLPESFWSLGVQPTFW